MLKQTPLGVRGTTVIYHIAQDQRDIRPNQPVQPVDRSLQQNICYLTTTAWNRRRCSVVNISNDSYCDRLQH